MPRWIEQQVGVRLLQLHDAIYKGTNGRIGHRFMPGTPPNLLLHTTGAKTGQARTTSVAYFRDGDAYLIVASEGGDPRSPGWYYNLKANPCVEINVGPTRFGVTARPVCPATPTMPGYGRSSARTSATTTRLTSSERRVRSQCRVLTPR
jgi:deazaflavin-dependent oxidoreductase (nitroreductase family)